VVGESGSIADRLTTKESEATVGGMRAEAGWKNAGRIDRRGGGGGGRCPTPAAGSVNYVEHDVIRIRQRVAGFVAAGSYARCGPSQPVRLPARYGCRAVRSTRIVGAQATHIACAPPPASN